MAGKYNRKRPNSVYGKQAAPPSRKRILPAKPTWEEADPEWRRWFGEVEQRRYDHGERQKKHWRIVEIDKDSAGEKIVRGITEPTRLGKTIKRALPERFIHLSETYSRIAVLWERAVGAEIVAESALHSFRAGVLTITVFSSILLQEIRQFHATAILADLRDIWTVDTPLLTIKYRIGDRQGE